MFVVFGVLLIIVLIPAVFTLCIFLKVMRRSEEVIPERNSKVLEREGLKEHTEEFVKGVEFISQNADVAYVNSRDGIKLAALCIPKENAVGSILLMHGFRSSPQLDFGCVAEKYYNMGLNVIMPYERAHGMSGGKYLTFGIKERFDVFSWIEYINSRFGANRDIFIDGLSMGCATVLMASGLGYPENVRGIIADCGYTSPYEIVVSVMKNGMHIPKYPFICFFELYCRIFAGFSLSEYSTLSAMNKNVTPILFAHGDADDFVPHEMTLRNYQTCISEKYLLLVNGAKHAMSYFKAREKYEFELDRFIYSHLSKNN